MQNVVTFTESQQWNFKTCRSESPLHVPLQYDIVPHNLCGSSRAKQYIKLTYYSIRYKLKLCCFVQIVKNKPLVRMALFSLYIRP